MKKLFTLLAAVMITACAWADGISPAADYSYRLNWNTSKSEMNFTYKTGHDQQAQYEIKWTSQLFALQQYDIENFKYAKTLTLNIAKTTTGNTTSMAVWDYGKNTLPTTGTTADSRIEFLKTVQGITGTWFYQTETPSSENYAATTATTWGNTALATAAYKSESSAFVATIDASKLTNVTMDGTTGKVRFLLTTNTPNAGTAAKYDAGSTLTVTNWAVYNETTSKGYDDLASAVSDANDGDVINVLSESKSSSRVNIAKNITINGGNNTFKSTNNGSAFLISSACTINDLTVGGITDSKAVFEFANSTTAFSTSINNVIVKDVNVGNQGVYRIKDKATVTLNGVTNTNITVTEGYGEVFVAAAAAACNLRGTCSVASAYLEKGKRLNVSGATISSPISLTFKDGYTIPTACVIQGSNTLNDFTVTNSNITLYVSKNNGGANNEMGVLSTSYDLSISSAGAATLVLPFDAIIPSDVKVYTLNYTSGNSTAKATEVTGTLKKNTPVYVKANEGTYTFSLAEDGTKGGTYNPISGALTGVYTKTTVPEDSYILYNGSKGVGFYLSNNSTVAPYRCYLTADGNGAKAITIGFDESTGIQAVNAEGKLVREGKFIENGRVVILKNGKKFNTAGQLIK